MTRLAWAGDPEGGPFSAHLGLVASLHRSWRELAMAYVGQVEEGAHGDEEAQHRQDRDQ